MSAETLNTTPTNTCFKLKSGEEIVGKSIETDFGYIVEHPIKIEQMQTAKGMVMIFVPFALTFAVTSLPLNIEDVYASADAPEGVNKMYIQATTGIEIAKPGLQLVKP